MPGEDGIRRIDEATVIEALARAIAFYRQKKEGRTIITSRAALIKSLLNSDVNASLYWLARLIAGGRRPDIHRQKALHTCIGRHWAGGSASDGSGSCGSGNHPG